MKCDECNTSLHEGPSIAHTLHTLLEQRLSPLIIYGVLYPRILYTSVKECLYMSSHCMSWLADTSFTLSFRMICFISRRVMRLSFFPLLFRSTFGTCEPFVFLCFFVSTQQVANKSENIAKDKNKLMTGISYFGVHLTFDVAFLIFKKVLPMKLRNAPIQHSVSTNKCVC